MKRWCTVGLLLGVLLLTGCVFFGPFGPVVLYDETFEDDANWYEGNTSSYQWWLEDGKYNVLVRNTYDLTNDPGYHSRRTTVGPFDNFRLSIEAEQVVGPDNNSYGVIFRISNDAKSYYRVRVSGDGFVKFDKSVAGTLSTIRNWEPTTAVHQGTEKNLIEIIADGNLFTIIVNQETLYTVADSSLISGGVGVAAAKYTSTGGELHIAFDNLRIEALQ